MSVTLTPEVADRIRQKIATAPYRNSDEVIEEALRLLDARDHRVQQIGDSVSEGLAAIERGEGIELTTESMKVRILLAEERARRGEQPHPNVCP